MHIFYAVASKLHYVGNLPACINWSDAQIKNGRVKIVKILKARPNEKDARIVFEVTAQGTRAINNGRIVLLSLLKKAEKNG